MIIYYNKNSKFYAFKNIHNKALHNIFHDLDDSDKNKV